MTPEALGALGIEALQETVCALHAELVRNGLVAWTSGNVSARVPGSAELIVRSHAAHQSRRSHLRG